MGEFGLIELIREAARNGDDRIRIGIGDDAAVLEFPPGYELVATTDTLNEGVHFLAGTSARVLGHKSLAVNLSDLAAMGASPRWVLLNLSMPAPDPGWLVEFMEGLSALAAQHDVFLVGGDTCNGPLSISLTALGLVRAGASLQRSGAQAGDLLVVSGNLGDAAYALNLLKSAADVPEEILNMLHQPLPRVGLGLTLVGKASSCIDISDGLLAEVGHITQASGCGAVIELDALPASGSLMGLNTRERWSLQLGGGDDYELCFTLPTDEGLAELEREADVKLTVIGKMVNSPGIQCVEPDGQVFEPAVHGFEHFTDKA